MPTKHIRAETWQRLEQHLLSEIKLRNQILTTSDILDELINEGIDRREQEIKQLGEQQGDNVRG